MNQAPFVDNSMPLLRKALDSEKMAPAFEEFLGREYPDLGLKINRCQVGKVIHKPNRECAIYYGLFARDKAGGDIATLFFARMLANGKMPKETKPNSDYIQLSGIDWKPVSYWPEMNMELRAFPYDPKLPYLRKVVDKEFVGQQAELHLKQLGLRGEWRCADVGGRLIKYRPGKGCVLRYELLMADAAGNERTVALYSKTYKNTKSRYVFEVLSKLSRQTACINGPLNIPDLAVHIDEANTIWMHAWEGLQMSHLDADFGWRNLPTFNLLPNVASWLAALHQIESLDMLNSSPSLLMILQNAHSSAIDTSKFLPKKRGVLESMAQTLQAKAPKSNGQEQQTPIHGAFKIAQILYRDNEVAVVDFDAIACGDPHYDLGEFIASLVHLSISDSVPTQSIKQSVELFLEEYEQRVPWECDRQRVAWYIVAFLLAKLHSSLKRLESNGTLDVEHAFDLLEDWLKQA